MTPSSPALRPLQTLFRCRRLPFLIPSSGGGSNCNVRDFFHNVFSSLTSHTPPLFRTHTGPVIEHHEFVARFNASQNGKSDSLGNTGRLLAMSFVIWASSFGIDENGQPQDPLEDHIYQYQDHKIDIHDQFDTDASAKLRSERRARTNEMVKEMLYLIDVHGILRKPSWDGVRILLMILPLAQGERPSISSSLFSIAQHNGI